MTKLKLTTFALVLAQGLVSSVASAAVDNSGVYNSVGNTSMSSGVVYVPTGENNGGSGGNGEGGSR